MNIIVIACVCCGATSKFTPGTILMWVITIESYVLGGVLGCYIQGGVTFKGALLFSVYGMCIYVYVYVYNYVHIACSSVRCWFVTITIHVV